MADTNDYEKIVRAKLGSREDVRDYDFMQFSVGVIRGLLGMLSDCRAQIAASERRANEMRQAFIDALNNSQATPPADALADALEAASNRCHGQDVAALRKAAAALRARPQAVAEAVAKDAAAILVQALEEIAWQRPLGVRPSKSGEAMERAAIIALHKYNALLSAADTEVAK